jgi:hypothetical protein
VNDIDTIVDARARGVDPETLLEDSMLPEHELAHTEPRPESSLGDLVEIS